MDLSAGKSSQVIMSDIHMGYGLTDDGYNTPIPVAEDNKPLPSFALPPNPPVSRYFGPECSLVRALVDVIRTGGSFETLAKKHGVPKRHRDMVAQELLATLETREEVILSLDPDSFVGGAEIDTLRNEMEKILEDLGPSLFFRKLDIAGKSYFLCSTGVYDNPEKPEYVVNWNGRTLPPSDQLFYTLINKAPGVEFKNGEKAQLRKEVVVGDNNFRLKVYLWCLPYEAGASYCFWVNYKNRNTGEARDVKKVKVTLTPETPSGFQVALALARRGLLL